MGSFLYYSIAHTSYTIMFSINTMMILIAIIYSLYNLEWQTTENQIPISWGNIFFDFFDRCHVLETISTITKKRINHRREYLWIVLTCMMLYTFQREEKPMSYLYTQLKFNWNINEFSNFRTFYSALFVSGEFIYKFTYLIL